MACDERGLLLWWALLHMCVSLWILYNFFFVLLFWLINVLSNSVYLVCHSNWWLCNGFEVLYIGGCCGIIIFWKRCSSYCLEPTGGREKSFHIHLAYAVENTVLAVSCYVVITVDLHTLVNSHTWPYTVYQLLNIKLNFIWQANLSPAPSLFQMLKVFGRQNHFIEFIANRQVRLL